MSEPRFEVPGEVLAECRRLLAEHPQWSRERVKELLERGEPIPVESGWSVLPRWGVTADGKQVCVEHGLTVRTLRG